MRVCLINPPRIHPKLWGKPSVFQPTDLAYVAAVLEKQHEVLVIDACAEGWKNLELDGMRYRQGLSIEDISKRIRQWSPNIVGISIPFTGWWQPAYDVASAAKSINKDIITMLFGLHPSVRAADCLTYPNVDFAIIGEPESTALELVGVLERGNPEENLKKVNGLAFIKNGETVFTPPRTPIQNLDSLPFPARHLLPMDIYFAAVKENPLRGEIRKPWAIMITSRGCPNQCVFCTIHNVMGRQWRSRSPENVVDEIEQLVQTYHIKQIDFVDDNMTLNKKRVETICTLIKERKIDIEWYTPNGVRADTLDESLLRKMKASGCKKIRIAPESGAQRVVDQIIKKNQKLEDVEKAVVLSKKVGIKVGCFFVLGLIGETKADIEETIKFAYKLRRLGADKFYFSVAMPMYGTELYDQAKRGGFLKAGFDNDSLGEVKPLIETSEFTVDEIQELCARANLVNHTFTSEKIVIAIRDPKKAIKFLLGKMG